MFHRFLLTSCLFLSAASGTLTGQSIQERALQVQNPRPSEGWVSDGIGYLSDSGALSEINQIITQLERNTSSEIAVVTIPSIGDESPKQFATTLFELWGIGKKSKDNGVLILHVLDQRRVEIETGYGLEAILPDILCKRILEQYIIPHFKSGEFSLGMALGVYAISKSISQENQTMNEKLDLDGDKFSFTDLPISHYQAIHSNEELSIERQSPGIIKRHIVDPTNSLKEFFYFWIAIAIVIIWFALGTILSLLPFGSEFLYNIYAYLGGWFSWLAGTFAVTNIVWKEIEEYDTFYSLLNVIPFSLALYFTNRWIGNSLRNNPRKCPSCKNKMKKLNEKKDDAHLSAGERTEEKIFSVDYDIWECKQCLSIHKEAYSGKTPASKCKKCNFKTYRNISVQVISQATYDHGGEEIHNYECAHCKLFESKRVSTPKLVKSTSSSSGSSGSWGGGSSSGSSGSWGGGSSGGGGSGSSY